MKFYPASSYRRPLLLLIVLAIVVAVAWFQRDQLVQFPNRMVQRAIRQNDYAAAHRWLRTSEWISADHPETSFLRARLYRHEGRVIDAREELQRATQLGTPEETIERESVLTLAQAGQMAAAEPYLTPLLSDPRDDGDEISEAFVVGYLKMRQFAIARTLIDAWIQDFPLDARPIFWKAMIDREMDQPEAAERGLRFALELKPDYHEAAFILGEVLYGDRKKSEEALPFYRLAMEAPSQREQALIGVANCLRSLGRSDEAITELREFLGHSPGSVDATVELAEIHNEVGEYARAVELLEPLVAANDHHKDLRYAYGAALRGIGKLEEAKPHIEFAAEAGKEMTATNRRMQLVAADPGNAELRYEIGEALLRYGSTTEALVWLESALACDPVHLKTHRLLAEYYEQKQKASGGEYAQRAAEHREFLERADAAGKQ